MERVDQLYAGGAPMAEGNIHRSAESREILDCLGLCAAHCAVSGSSAHSLLAITFLGSAMQLACTLLLIPNNTNRIRRGATAALGSAKGIASCATIAVLVATESWAPHLHVR
jgi:hypothetical protein